MKTREISPVSSIVAAMAAIVLVGIITSANAATEVTPDHIVIGTVAGRLIAVDVPFVSQGTTGGPDWPEDADDGFTTVNDGIFDYRINDKLWEPDGAPAEEAGSFFTYGNGPVPSVKWVFNLAASGINIPDGAIINGVYATWFKRGVDGITYQYTEGAASDSIVRQTGGAGPNADLVLSWTDSIGTVRNGTFERIFTGPIVVEGGDGFELWGTDNIGNAAHIDAVILDVTMAAPGMQITAISPDVDPANLPLTWESKAGKLYDVLGTTDPSADPQIWTPLLSDVAATPPENTQVFTKPVDAFSAFAVLEKPLPPLFEDDFESDLGWTVGVDAGTDTDWERGAPSVIGPAAANSPVTCYGTNIDATYGNDVNITLRSPAIDLSAATAATLTFQQFYDIEAGFDAGAVRVLKSSDLTQLGADIVNPVDGTVTEWTEFTGALPAEAIGETVVLEFRFTSDGFAPSAQAGWYIDDVSVTVE